MKQNRDVQQVKETIVKGYRAGICDHNGCHIPKEKRGMAGKGSHFIFVTDLYRDNYAKVFGHD